MRPVPEVWALCFILTHDTCRNNPEGGHVGQYRT